MNLWKRSLSLRLASSSNSWAVSDQEAVFSAVVLFFVWGHHFRSTFIAYRYYYMINNECVKGKKVEKVFSGSRIWHNWFADFIILLRGFHILYIILICGFHNPLSGISYPLHCPHLLFLPYLFKYFKVFNNVVFSLILITADSNYWFIFILFR